MYDGVTASRVPSDGWGVAGYVNGSWPSYQALVNRFPHLAHISITVNAQGTALVLDVEDKDATPQQAPGWVQRMRAKGIPYPVVYMNASAWQSVKNEFAAQGVRPPLYWVAKYDGVAVVPAGAIAKQHTNTAGYDVSAVADYWPGVDPAPEPTVIHHAKEHAMLIIRSITGSDQIWGQVGDRYWHIASSSDLNAYRAACVKAGVPVVELNVSAAEHANLQAA
jgi:hypothetical protein